MAKFKQLRDLDRFPGFVQTPRFRGRFGDPIAVVIRLHRRQKKTVCGVGGQVSFSRYDQRPRRVRDLSSGDKRVYRSFPIRRVFCSRCVAVKNERLDWLADHPLDTKRFAFYVGRRGHEATITESADELHLDWDAVKDLDKQYPAVIPLAPNRFGRQYDREAEQSLNAAMSPF